MAGLSGRGSFPSNSVGRHSELSSWLLPPSSSSSNAVQQRRSIVTRVVSVVGMLVSLLTLGMIMWLERDLQMTVANFEKQLVDHKANFADAKAKAASVAAAAAEKATTTSVSLKPSTFRKPEILECLASYGAAQNRTISYPNVLAVRSWIHPSGKHCDSAIADELVIREAGSYIVICQAALSTVDHNGVVKGSSTHALRARLELHVRVDDTDIPLKSVENVVLHYSTYQLNTVVGLPDGARLAVLLTSFAGVTTNFNIRWHNVTIAWSRLGGDRQSR